MTRPSARLRQGSAPRGPRTAKASAKRARPAGGLAAWTLCAAVSTLVLGAAVVAFSHGAGLAAAYGAVLVPAFVSMLVVPGAARRWYRWVCVLAIGYVVEQAFVSLFLLVAVAWLLHVTWVVDRPADTRLRVPHMYRSGSRVKG